MKKLLLASLALIPCFTGCSPIPTNDTPGSSGRAAFAYTGESLFGTPIDRPMMPGASTTIAVRPVGALPPVTARSSDPSVLTVTGSSRSCITSVVTRTPMSVSESSTSITLALDQSCPAGTSEVGTLTVDAVAPGTATLILTLADGSVFDSVPVAVAPPARLAIRCGSDSEADPLRVPVGGTCRLEPTVFDASGAALLGGYVSVSLDDPSIAEMSTLLSPHVSSIGIESHEFFGTNLVGLVAGDTRAVVSLGSLKIIVPVQVR